MPRRANRWSPRSFATSRPQIAQWFDAEAGRLEPLIERRRALTTRDRTQALLQIATAAAANYRAREAGTRPARL